MELVNKCALTLGNIVLIQIGGPGQRSVEQLKSVFFSNLNKYKDDNPLSTVFLLSALILDSL